MMNKMATKMIIATQIQTEIIAGLGLQAAPNQMTL